MILKLESFLLICKIDRGDLVQAKAPHTHIGSFSPIEVLCQEAEIFFVIA